MTCRGMTCMQGRAPCQSPLLCSGASEEVESAIRLHRAVQPMRIDVAEPDPPLYTCEEAMSLPEQVIYWLLAIVALAVITTGVYQIWPLIRMAVTS